MAHSRIEWFWKSSEWNPYSDVENAIIEDAYQASTSDVNLDNYHIDFEQRIQISTNDSTEQHAIKRMEINRENDPLREVRFMSNPTIPSISFHNLAGLKRIFTDTFEEQFGIKSTIDWDNRRTELVTKAMKGILSEGQLSGKQCEAKWLVEQLDKAKSKSKKEIGECCVYLYTLESFLYKILNQTMRLIGDKQYEHIWKKKI
ncbi:hypothetical protein I4U23_011750 [Adineta vaga]|nr:hypothetical protein I4U23_011750 [Adineta vaga]